MSKPTIEEILAPRPEAYTGIDSHPGLTHYGLYDTVVARD